MSPRISDGDAPYTLMSSPHVGHVDYQHHFGMNSLLKGRSKVSLWTTWRSESILFEEQRVVQVLLSDFKQFREKIDEAPITRQLTELFYLEQHFMSSTDSRCIGQSLFQMLQSEIETRLAPVPSQEDLKVFAEKMFDLKKTKFPENVAEGELSLAAGDWAKVLRYANDTRHSQYDTLVKEQVEAFKIFIVERLQGHEDFYGDEKSLHYSPLLQWCARSLRLAAKGDRITFLATSQWKTLHTFPKGESFAMPWTRVGYVLNDLIRSGKMDEIDCVPPYDLSAHFRPLRTVVLPEFDHNLQKLSSVEQAKLNDLASLKAKVLAGLVTGGISFGHVISQRLFPPHCCQV